VDLDFFEVLEVDAACRDAEFGVVADLLRERPFSGLCCGVVVGTAGNCAMISGVFGDGRELDVIVERRLLTKIGLGLLEAELKRSEK
jgi:hypothetical protein